jgi:Arm DNA-binding domain
LYGAFFVKRYHAIFSSFAIPILLFDPRRRMHADGGGLYLQVTLNGASWIYRFMLNGWAREMGLGPLALFGLQEARGKALDARRLRHEGVDPIDTRRAARFRQRLEAAHSCQRVG